MPRVYVSKKKKPRIRILLHPLRATQAGPSLTRHAPLCSNDAWSDLYSTALICTVYCIFSIYSSLLHGEVKVQLACLHILRTPYGFTVYTVPSHSSVHHRATRIQHTTYYVLRSATTTPTTMHMCISIANTA